MDIKNTKRVASSFVKKYKGLKHVNIKVVLGLYMDEVSTPIQELFRYRENLAGQASGKMAFM